MSRIALGFREHAGWAAVVLLAEAGPLPNVIHRSRIELCPQDLPREAHHAAAQLDSDGAKALVAAVTEAAADATHGCVDALMHAHADLAVAGAPIGERPVPTSPSATRKAHTMMHAAEGQLYREALAEGCARAGLPVHRFSRNALTSLAAEARGFAGSDVTVALTAMGREIGAPWARDQKDAALCAWLALLKGAS